MLRMLGGSFENCLDHHSSDRIASIKSVQKNVIRKSLLPERIATFVFPNALK